MKHKMNTKTYVIWQKEFNNHIPVLLKELNMLQKSDRMIPISHFPNLYNNFNKTGALKITFIEFIDPLFIIEVSR